MAYSTYIINLTDTDVVRCEYLLASWLFVIKIRGTFFSYFALDMSWYKGRSERKKRRKKEYCYLIFSNNGSQ